MAILNDSGVEIQKLEGILQDLQSIARKNFADLVEPDDELDLSDSSLLGRILAIIAEPEALNEELLLQLWQSLDPNQAEGVFLEKILDLLGIKRKSETRGFAGLIVHGTLGVTLPEKSLVGSRITGDVFETTVDVTFSKTNAHGVVLMVTNTEPNTSYKLSYTGAYGNNRFPPIEVVSVAGDTKNMIARRFMETLKANSKLLTASVTNDDNVKVEFIDENYFGNFETEGSFTVIETYMPVTSLAVTAGAVRQAAGTLDAIQSATVGWLGVTNPFDSLASEPRESDPDLRRRAKFSKGMKSTSNRMSLYSDLYDLNGVRFVNIKENIYDNAAGERGAKGISVVVLGGDDQEIAQTILNNKPLGCLTDGKQTIDITDAVGTEKIKFSRPEFVDIEIQLSLAAESTFPQNGKILIQEALVRYFDTLDVGDVVQWSKLFGPINEVGGQSVTSLLISRKGGVPQMGNIELDYNQLAVISFEDIHI